MNSSSEELASRLMCKYEVVVTVVHARWLSAIVWGIQDVTFLRLPGSAHVCSIMQCSRASNILQNASLGNNRRTAVCSLYDRTWMILFVLIYPAALCLTRFWAWHWEVKGHSVVSAKVTSNKRTPGMSRRHNMMCLTHLFAKHQTARYTNTSSLKEEVTDIYVIDTPSLQNFKNCLLTS